MGSKRHRRQVLPLGLFAVLRKRLTDHRRPFLVVIAGIFGIAGLMLANVGLGLNLNSRFWKLAGRLPGANKLSRSAVLANLITAPEDQLANLLLAAKQVLEEGRTGAIALDETLVLGAGSRAVSAAQNDPRLAQIAWQTASAAISYGDRKSTRLNSSH